MMSELDIHMLYHALLSHFPGHVYWKNRDGIYLGCNEQQARSLGLASHRDIIGKSDTDLPWNKKDAARMRENDWRIMQTGEAEILEETAYFDGKESPVLSQKIPLRNHQQETVGLLGLSIDISASKKAEALLQEAKDHAEAVSRAKSDFMAVASHELRTPIAGILAMIHFIHHPLTQDEQKKEYLHHLTEASQHLSSLVNAILDVTDLEAGQWKLTPAPIHLRQLVTETVTMLTAKAEEKGLTLQVDYPPEVISHVIGDARTLRQLIANLVSNAIQFTEQGQVNVKVACLPLTIASALAVFRLTVEDTGIGIPADKLSDIFEHFHQVAPPYTRPTSQAGIGLGLTIVKKLMACLEGTISVISEEHHGSAFICEWSLPLQHSSNTGDPT